MTSDSLKKTDITVLATSEYQPVRHGPCLCLEYLSTAPLAVADAGVVLHVGKQEYVDARVPFGYIKPVVRRYDGFDQTAEFFFCIVERPRFYRRERPFVFLRI